MKTLKRRQRECKTDYHKRIKLLKGNTPRIIFRKTNRYILAQYVTSKQAQDKVEVGVNSKKILDYGWPKEFAGSLKSIPAAYLTGLLMGKMIIKNKLDKQPIIDIGMTRNIHKSKIYAFINGLIDAKIIIKCNKELFPEENRLKGKHMKNDISKTFDKVKEKIEKEN